MIVELIDCMGTDVSVVNAARVRFPHAWGALFVECAATDQAR